MSDNRLFTKLNSHLFKMSFKLNVQYFFKSSLFNRIAYMYMSTYSMYAVDDVHKKN